MKGLSSLYRGLSGVEPTADDIGAVKKVGDTMTGALILSGSPTELNQAATKSYVDSNLNAKQDTLVSGTNIKTINSSSILGSGNLSITASPATTTTQGVAFLSNPITISNNATDANNDIDFSAGNIQFSDGSGQATYAGGTGQLDVLFGTGNGMLATGTKAINSTYHLYMVSNLTTGVSKPLAILGIAGTAPDPTSVLPSGYTKFERRGWVITDPSGNIRAFTLTANRFEYNSNITDLNATLTGSEVSITVSAPWGLRTRVCLVLCTNATGSGAAVAKVYSHNITTPTITLFNATAYAGVGLVAGTGYAEATTNLSSQIKINAVAISGSPTLTGVINTSAIIDLTLRY